MTVRPLVIGVGNRFRLDDGVGWEVAARIDRSDVEVVHLDGEPARLVEAWADHDPVVVVDAVRSPGRAGEVTVRTPDDLPASRLSATHGGGIPAAVALGRALGRLPTHLWIVGIAGAEFGDGAGCSAAVAPAVDDAVHVVHGLLDRAREASKP